MLLFKKIQTNRFYRPVIRMERNHVRLLPFVNKEKKDMEERELDCKLCDALLVTNIVRSAGLPCDAFLGLSQGSRSGGG